MSEDTRLRQQRKKIILHIIDNTGLPFTPRDEETIREVCEEAIQKHFDVKVESVEILRED